MPTYRTLVHKTRQWGTTYYWDPRIGNPIICSKALRRKVELPPQCPEIRVVTTPRMPRNEGFFDITERGKIVDVRYKLTREFQKYLQTQYARGDRYVYIDYKE